MVIPGDNSRRNFAYARRPKLEKRNYAQRARFADILSATAEKCNKYGGGGKPTADERCAGCDEIVATQRYEVDFVDGHTETDVRYCDDCADLARMNWNGETAAIRRAP